MKKTLHFYKYSYFKTAKLLKKISVTLIIISSILCLSDCGQKGPLYIPKDNPDVIF